MKVQSWRRTRDGRIETTTSDALSPEERHAALQGYAPPTLEGRALADLGAQVAALRAERGRLRQELNECCGCRWSDGTGEVPCESHAALRNDNAAKDARIAGQRTRAEQAKDARDATALAMMANARDVLAVHRDCQPEAHWLRTLHDTLDGYLRRHQEAK